MNVSLLPAHRTIALVGRPNVGKSALFNRLAGSAVSLVHDQPGVTRDRITAEIRLAGHLCTLVDTGGIGLDDSEGFASAIRKEVEVALATATEVLMVVDGREGIHVLDREVARLLRRTKLPITVVVNKVDRPEMVDFVHAFRPLGFSEIAAVSAVHGVGIRELAERLTATWADASETQKRAKSVFRVSLVGRPNVGKSALINSLLGQERVMVSPIAGTTRDAVDIHFQVADELWSLIDTAGMRKRARVLDPLERATASRSAHTINRSDVCVLVVDAVRGAEEQEKKIAGLIQEAGRACIVFVNKWDLAVASLENNTPGARQVLQEEYEEALRGQLFFIPYAPIIFGSALEETGGRRLFDRLRKVREARRTQVGTGVFNRMLEHAQRMQPLGRVRGAGGKIFYGSQKKDPDLTCPTFVLFMNYARAWNDAYGRFLEGLLRKKYGFEGCPIRWDIRERNQEENPTVDRKARRAPKASFRQKKRESESGRSRSD
jgi:GTP-binding protein